MRKTVLLSAVLVTSTVASAAWSAPAAAHPGSPAGPGQPSQSAPAPTPAPAPVPTPAPASTRGWIGVALEPVRDDLAQSLHLGAGEGALVASVVPDGPAARAGVRVGDVIVEVGSAPIHGSEAVQREIWARPPGTSVQLAVVRGPSRTRLTLVTAEPPPSATDADGAGGAGGGPWGAWQPWAQLPWAQLPSWAWPGSPWSQPGGPLGQAPPGSPQRPGWRWLQLPPSSPPTSQSPPRLGVALRSAPHGRGLVVTRVEPGSLAASVGVQPGDVILEADGQPVHRQGDVRRAMSDGAVSLRIDRNGTRVEVAVASARWSTGSP